MLAAGFALSGCMQATTYEAPKARPSSRATRNLLAKVSYDNVPVPEPSAAPSSIITARKLPGSIVVDSDNHYLYLVQDDGKAIRYGITVGEEAMAWSGIAKVGSKTEWPTWHPTTGDIPAHRACRHRVPGGVDNPMGSRALYLYSGGKDTLFRIHGTNQPEYIGASISSGCIRMTNEDVIDLYDRVGQAPSWWCSSRSTATRRTIRKMALQGGGQSGRCRSNRRRLLAVEALANDDQERRFCRRFFVAGFSSRGGSARRHFRCWTFQLPAPHPVWRRPSRIWRHPARRRPRAAALPPAARPATAARLCGSGSHTFHWQIR